MSDASQWAQGKTAHDLWFESFGEAFHGPGNDMRKAKCEACNQTRHDVMKKGRLICVRCASMSMKKPKAAGGVSGPQAFQVVLVQPDSAVYTAAQLAVPKGLPEGSRIEAVFGDVLLARVLYAPPEPPFLLLRLDRNSDPVLNGAKITRSLSRIYVGSVQCIQVNQPELRKVVDALLAVSDAPANLLRQLAGMQPALFRGPNWNQHKFIKAAEEREKLADLDARFDEVFPESGHWLVKPKTPEWELLGLVLRNEGWKEPGND